MAKKDFFKKIAVAAFTLFVAAGCSFVGAGLQDVSAVKVTSDKINASSIQLNTNQTVTIEAGQSKIYSFTPTKTDMYIFFTKGEWDTYAYLYEFDKNDNCVRLSENDDFSDRNCGVEYKLTAGKTYYYEVSLYSVSKSADFQCMLTTADRYHGGFIDIKLDENQYIKLGAKNTITPVLYDANGNAIANTSQYKFKWIKSPDGNSLTVGTNKTLTIDSAKGEDLDDYLLLVDNGYCSFYKYFNVHNQDESFFFEGKKTAFIETSSEGSALTLSYNVYDYYGNNISLRSDVSYTWNYESSVISHEKELTFDSMKKEDFKQYTLYVNIGDTSIKAEILLVAPKNYAIVTVDPFHFNDGENIQLYAHAYDIYGKEITESQDYSFKWFDVSDESVLSESKVLNVANASHSNLKNYKVCLLYKGDTVSYMDLKYVMFSNDKTIPTLNIKNAKKVSDNVYEAVIGSNVVLDVSYNFNGNIYRHSPMDIAVFDGHYMEGTTNSVQEYTYNVEEGNMVVYIYAYDRDFNDLNTFVIVIKGVKALAVKPAVNPTTKPATPEINVKATKIRTVKRTKKSAKFKVKKVKDATGYQIKYSTNRKLKKATFKKFKKATFTIKKLKTKKTYYVRVRAYQVVGKKTFYSKWTKTKRIKK